MTLNKNVCKNTQIYCQALKKNKVKTKKQTLLSILTHKTDHKVLIPKNVVNFKSEASALKEHTRLKYVSNKNNETLISMELISSLIIGFEM